MKKISPKKAVKELKKRKKTTLKHMKSMAKQIALIEVEIAKLS